MVGIKKTGCIFKVFLCFDPAEMGCFSSFFTTDVKAPPNVPGPQTYKIWFTKMTIGNLSGRISKEMQMTIFRK